MNEAEKLVSEKRPGLIEQSLQNMHQLLDAEIERLEQLAKVNPNIRQTEIEHQKEQRDNLAHLIGSAQLRMEAARVILAT